MAVKAGWEDYVDRTGARVAVLPEDSALALALVDRLGWNQKEADAGYVFLTAPD